jgi:prepilin-type N-terminal cleavage/methylation domain-containing protein
MPRRPGLSLTEVLVALFIMGIGAVAILTLFPLGALNMAQALRDDRTTQCAAQAGAYLRDYWQQRYTSQVINPPNPDLYSELFYRAMNNPQVMATDPLGATAGEGRNIIPVTDSTDSYPVLVDPMGYLAPRPTVTSKRWLGDDGYGNTGAATAVPRASLSQLLPTPVGPILPARVNTLALRTCSLLDGFGYDPNTGSPALVGGVIDRDVRYNWLWVVQRLNGQTKDQATVTVVVFDKRGNQFAPPGSETVHTPTYAQPEVTAEPLKGKPFARRGESRVSFAKGTEPLVQKGGWLMDATVTTVVETAPGSGRFTVFVPPTPPTGGGAPPQAGVRNAHFYRVIGVTDDGVNVDFELETALRPDTGWDYDTANPDGSGALRPQYRRFVALAGVAEVFVLTVPLKVAN